MFQLQKTHIQGIEVQRHSHSLAKLRNAEDEFSGRNPTGWVIARSGSALSVAYVELPHFTPEALTRTRTDSTTGKIDLIRGSPILFPKDNMKEPLPSLTGLLKELGLQHYGLCSP